MGLDFTVSETRYIGIDENGHDKYEVTELENFGNTGYTILEYCPTLYGMNNCSTVAIEDIELLECLDEMRKDKEEGSSSDLEYAIDELYSFIEREHITEDSNRVFDIHIWY